MLVPHHGSTETSQRNTFRPREDISEWDWLRLPETLILYMQMDQQDEGKIYELVT